MNASTHAENAANDIAAHLHPFTNLATHPQLGPLVIQRGDGIFVEDDQGRRYLEAMSGLWCASLGFSNARLAKAGSEALHGLPYYHTFNGRSNPAAIALAEKLLALAPVPMSKVFFANSGSEANDSSVKLVWYYHNAIGKPEKKKIIARRNAYHGVTVAAASLSGLVPNHRDFDLPIDRILHVDCPHHFRYAEAGESEEDFATRLAAALEQRILDEGPETVGAFIAEPVMGAGGVLVPPATYFDKVQKVLARYEVLLIADEVICGFGRTGQMFGSTTFGLKPDILTAAKALSSGYVPISAVMVNEKVHAAVAANSGKIGTFGHGFDLLGPSGGLRHRAGDAQGLRRREHPRARAVAGAAIPERAAELRRAQVRRRGARRGAHRRDRAVCRPRQAHALRSRAEGRRTPRRTRAGAGAHRARHGRLHRLLPAAHHHGRTGRRHVRALRPRDGDLRRKLRVKAFCTDESFPRGFQAER